MVGHWLHNPMVQGSNPGGDGNFFSIFTSFHLITSSKFCPPMVPRWSPDGPPMVPLDNVIKDLVAFPYQ